MAINFLYLFVGQGKTLYRALWAFVCEEEIKKKRKKEGDPEVRGKETEKDWYLSGAATENMPC